MPQEFYTLLTDAGRAIVAAALVVEETVDFATAKLGDGDGSYPVPAVTDTELVNEVWTGTPTVVKRHPTNLNWIIVDIRVPAEDGGFTVREIGIFATDGTMICHGVYPATVKPVLSSGSGKDLWIRLIVAVENATAVTLTFEGLNDPTLDEKVPLGGILKASFDLEAWEDGELNEPTYMACDGRTLLVAEYPDLAARLNRNLLTGFSGWALVAPGVYSVAEANGVLFAHNGAGDTSTIYTSIDQGATWSPARNLPGANYQLINAVYAFGAYWLAFNQSLTQKAFVKTTDLVTFTEIIIPYTGDNNGGTMASVVKSGAELLFFRQEFGGGSSADDQVHIYVSTNGTTWAHRGAIASATQEEYFRAVVDSLSRIYFLTSAGLIYSDNDFASSTAFGSPVNGAGWNTIAVNPATDVVVVANYSNGKVYKTANRGGAWTEVTASVGSPGASAVTWDGEKFFVIGGGKTYSSVDDGVTWVQEVASGSPSVGLGGFVSGGANTLLYRGYGIIRTYSPDEFTLPDVPDAGDGLQNFIKVKEIAA